MNNIEQTSPTRGKQGCYEFKDGDVMVRCKPYSSWLSVTVSGLLVMTTLKEEFVLRADVFLFSQATIIS